MATRSQPKLLAQGKPRMLGGGTRPWRVRLYAPGSGSNKYQVYFRAPAGEGEPWKRVLRRASSEEEARKIFAQAEAALDTESDDAGRSPTSAPPGRSGCSARSTSRDSIERGKQPRTMEGRESRLNAHILPTIGDVPVTKWRVEHSRRVMEKGSKTLFSQRGREDLRGQLAAMRKLAWRLGWLDRSIDPLDGLEIGRANVLHGATAQYVDPRLRPETRQVRAMAAAADKLCGPEGTDPLMTRLPLFGTKIRVAGFGGLRLGEQNALRAIDVFFERGYVHVNGSWITPRRQAGFRGPVKNHTPPRGAAAQVAHARRAPPPRQGAARPAREGVAPAGPQRAGGRAPAPRVTGGAGEGQEPRLVELPRRRPRTSCGSSSTPSPACP